MKDYTQVERDNAAATIEDAANNLQEAINMAIAALRGPQPDPITGLVPCGWCGPERIGWFSWNRAMRWREGNEN